MIAAKQPIITYPTRTNQIPRHAPPPHWASHPYVLFAAAGLLPFGTIFVELYFAMTSIWQVSVALNPGEQAVFGPICLCTSEGLLLASGQMDMRTFQQAHVRH